VLYYVYITVNGMCFYFVVNYLCAIGISVDTYTSQI
jgi:hypothetical protein